MPFVVGPSRNPVTQLAWAGLRTGNKPDIGKPISPKPGKKTPTREEREWMEWVTGYGCIACRLDGRPPRPTAVHHILQGGRRMGHLFSLGLCDPGHHQQGQDLGLTSRHPWKTRFEAKYGTELELLQMLQAESPKAGPALASIGPSAIKKGAKAMKLRIRTEREHKGYLVRVWRDWVEVAYLVLARVNTEALEAISAIVAALAGHGRWRSKARGEPVAVAQGSERRS